MWSYELCIILKGFACVHDWYGVFIVLLCFRVFDLALGCSASVAPRGMPRWFTMSPVRRVVPT